MRKENDSTMNVFLLGNGFDLGHNFPTAYIDFLKTTKFLVDYYDESWDKVGSVFGHPELQKLDTNIKRSYQRHSMIYDHTDLDKDRISSLVNEAKKNIWFRFLLQSFNCDIGWIDFEKEIASVVEAFGEFFDKASIKFNKNNYTSNAKNRFIIFQFGDFFRKADPTPINSGLQPYLVKQEYTIEEPFGSNHYEINKKKIIDILYSSLNSLADMLRNYLCCFVDEPSKTMKIVGHLPIANIYSNADYVITFNYTNTFELLYSPADIVDHIHGNIHDKIVLGINPNENDELENLDVSFIQFKKYYQRVFLKTDISYLENIQSIPLLKKMDNVVLHVIGHSLDITDEDIIKDVFGRVGNINIYYHDESANGVYIKNLVAMFGKSGFDSLRISKNIQFLPCEKIDWNKQN